MKTKILEYPPITNPSEQQGLLSKSCMSHRPATIPKYVLNFFLWGLSAFPVIGLTWTTDLSAPGGLVAKDRSRVALRIHFNVDGDSDAIVGGGGEAGGVAMGL